MSVRNDAMVELIRNRLSIDYRTAALPIDVISSDGYVSLVGVVDTTEQKRVAIQLVSGMIGVRYVKDELKIRSATVAAEMNNHSRSRPATFQR